MFLLFNYSFILSFVHFFILLVASLGQFNSFKNQFFLMKFGFSIQALIFPG